MTIRITLLSTLVLTSVTLWGQELDSVSLDLKRLADQDFFKKYSFYDSSTTQQDIGVTKLIWSLPQVRKVNQSLRKKGVPTLTRIDQRPTQENPYYLIGHYQLPGADHLMRMSSYRIDAKLRTIDYQNLNDLIKGKWKRIK
jgi:hypothetical protein